MALFSLFLFPKFRVSAYSESKVPLLFTVCKQILKNGSTQHQICSVIFFPGIILHCHFLFLALTFIRFMIQQNKRKLEMYPSTVPSTDPDAVFHNKV